MTLTLQQFENIEKQDYICLVDLDEQSSKLIKENTNREIIEMTHWVKQEEIKNKSFEERMGNVEDLLKKYQAAHLVVTNRLHVALPCLALGTKVLLIHKEDFEKDRLGTYLKYLNSCTDVEFATQSNIKEILENPKENSKEYLTIRNDLIEKCEQFVQKVEKEEIDITDLPEIEEYKKYTKNLKWYQQLYEKIRIKAKNNDYEEMIRYKEYKENEKQMENEKLQLQEEYEDLKKKYENVTNELGKVYNSKSWKLRNKLIKLIPKKGE